MAITPRNLCACCEFIELEPCAGNTAPYRLYIHEDEAPVSGTGWYRYAWNSSGGIVTGPRCWYFDAEAERGPMARSTPEVKSVRITGLSGKYESCNDCTESPWTPPTKPGNNPNKPPPVRTCTPIAVDIEGLTLHIPLTPCEEDYDGPQLYWSRYTTDPTPKVRPYDVGGWCFKADPENAVSSIPSGGVSVTCSGWEGDEEQAEGCGFCAKGYLCKPCPGYESFAWRPLVIFKEVFEAYYDEDITFTHTDPDSKARMCYSVGPESPVIEITDIVQVKWNVARIESCEQCPAGIQAEACQPGAVADVEWTVWVNRTWFERREAEYGYLEPSYTFRGPFGICFKVYSPDEYSSGYLPIPPGAYEWFPHEIYGETCEGCGNTCDSCTCGLPIADGTEIGIPVWLCSGAGVAGQPFWILVDEVPEDLEGYQYTDFGTNACYYWNASYVGRLIPRGSLIVPPDAGYPSCFECYNRNGNPSPHNPYPPTNPGSGNNPPTPEPPEPCSGGGCEGIPPDDNTEPPSGGWPTGPGPNGPADPTDDGGGCGGCGGGPNGPGTGFPGGGGPGGGGGGGTITPKPTRYRPLGACGGGSHGGEYILAGQVPEGTGLVKLNDGNCYLLGEVTTIVATKENTAINHVVRAYPTDDCECLELTSCEDEEDKIWFYKHEALTDGKTIKVDDVCREISTVMICDIDGDVNTWFGGTPEEEFDSCDDCVVACGNCFEVTWTFTKYTSNAYSDVDCVVTQTTLVCIGTSGIGETYMCADSNCAPDIFSMVRVTSGGTGLPGDPFTIGFGNDGGGWTATRYDDDGNREGAYTGEGPKSYFSTHGTVSGVSLSKVAKDCDAELDCTATSFTATISGLTGWDAPLNGSYTMSKTGNCTYCSPGNPPVNGGKFASLTFNSGTRTWTLIAGWGVGCGGSANYAGVIVHGPDGPTGSYTTFLNVNNKCEGSGSVG